MKEWERAASSLSGQVARAGRLRRIVVPEYRRNALWPLAGPSSVYLACTLATFGDRGLPRLSGPPFAFVYSLFDGSSWLANCSNFSFVAGHRTARRLLPQLWKIEYVLGRRSASTGRWIIVQAWVRFTQTKPPVPWEFHSLCTCILPTRQVHAVYGCWLPLAIILRIDS